MGNEQPTVTNTDGTNGGRTGIGTGTEQKNPFQTYGEQSSIEGATFSNPEYVPDKIIKDKAVDWIVKNFVKKSKSERATAIESFPTIAKEKAYRNYAENIAEDILNLGRTEGRSQLSSLKDIGKKIALKN